MGYEELHDQLGRLEHVALVMGNLGDCAKPAIVRVHSKCLTGEVFGSLKCDCAQQLEYALKTIGALGRGVLIYLDQEGRGIGLLNKLRAYQLQAVLGYDTIHANRELGFPTDLRDFRVAAQILKDLKLHSITLLSNNPEKATCLREAGLEVELVPIRIAIPTAAQSYVRTKVEKLGHVDPECLERDRQPSLDEDLYTTISLGYLPRSKNGCPPLNANNSLGDAVARVISLTKSVLINNRSILGISTVHYDKLLEALRARVRIFPSSSVSHISKNKSTTEPERELGLCMFFGTINYCFKHPYSLKEYVYTLPNETTLRRSTALLEALRRSPIDWGKPGLVTQVSIDQWREALQATETDLYDLEGRLSRIVEFGSYLVRHGISSSDAMFCLVDTNDVFELLVESSLFEDPFLKRAQLTTVQVMEHITRRVGKSPDITPFTVMPDYRIPQLLYNLGVIRFLDASLRERILRWEILEPDSDEEQALRAATVEVGQMLAFDVGLCPAAIDALLWQLAQEYLALHPCPIPHMLVPTDRY